MKLKGHIRLILDIDLNGMETESVEADKPGRITIEDHDIFFDDVMKANWYTALITEISSDCEGLEEDVEEEPAEESGT